MSTPSKIPAAAAGSKWHRLLVDDDSAHPRVVDFWHVFPERRQALDFVATVDDRDLEISISYYHEHAMWQTVVKRFMVPIPQELAALELSLAAHARSAGGLADGWDEMSDQHVGT